MSGPTIPLSPCAALSHASPLRIDAARFAAVSSSRRWRPGSVKMVAAALRSFFRFFAILGVGDPRLPGAVPTVARWRLSTLPRFLDDKALAQLHRSFDTTRAIGRRDRAIVLCLSALGLRACELADLRLEDIDWQAGSLRIRCRKTRRGHVLPLPEEVGAAIVAYLRFDRPQTAERHIFLTQCGARALCARAVRDVVRAAVLVRRAAAPSPVRRLRRGIVGDLPGVIGCRWSEGY